MQIVFALVNAYFMPILAVIFCVNLVDIIKKVKNDEATERNTLWLTVSFVLIVWSISAKGINF